jgi:DNA-directed RNA polymerase subunit RPC12/RpoP
MGTLPDHRLRKSATEFACRACGSPAVVYPDRLSDDAPVRCQRCRTVLCTLREFRLSAEPGMGGI